jgi:hypothetical protein
VFFGGTKAGLKKAEGNLPPIKINSLKTTIAMQLKAAPVVTKALEDKPDQMLELLDRYWMAVRAAFPDPWLNRRDFVLLQAIGLGAFAKLGGVILERAWDAGELSQTQIASQLAPASGVSLRREDYPGIAGAGGAQYLAEVLISATDSDKVKVTKNLEQLTVDAPSPLDA